MNFCKYKAWGDSFLRLSGGGGGPGELKQSEMSGFELARRTIGGLDIGCEVSDDSIRRGQGGEGFGNQVGVHG